MSSAPWPDIGFVRAGDATPALLAAYRRMFDRRFPAGLLPAAPLRRIRAGIGSRLSAAIAAWRGDHPFGRSVDLVFASPVVRSRRHLVGFGLRGLMTAPPGYFVAGFAAKPLGALVFYYVRRDAWSSVAFRFPCDGPKSRRDAIAAIPRILERFDEFARALRPSTRSLVAFEKDGFSAHYAIATQDGTVARNRPQFGDPDFARLLDQA